MNVTPEEARESLVAIQQTRARTLRGLASYAYYSIIWGLLWLIGFLISQFVQPFLLNWIWLAVVILGVGGSAVIGATQGGRIRTMPDSTQARINAQLAVFFPALYMFGVMWLVVFWPLSSHQIALFWISLVMFSYVVLGAWVRIPWLIGFGIGVTVVSLIGYYLVPGYFFLWSAVFAGGAVLANGIYPLLRWSNHG